MEINELAAFGHAISAVFFGVLAVLLLSWWKDRPNSAFIALASGATAIWAGIQTIGALGYLNSPVVLLSVEWMRNLSWLVAATTILRSLDKTRSLEEFAWKYSAGFLAIAALLLGSYVIRTPDSMSMMGVVGGGVILSALILIVVEQIFRNAPFDSQSGLKYFCVGVAGLFVYDFAIFTLTAINLEMDVNQWAARGFVNAFFALPLGLAVQRSFRLSLDTHIPRQIVLYSFTVIATGFFIILLVMGDYYVKTYAGTWGGVVRIVLFVWAISVLVLLLVSSTIRARVRVFVMKTFFEYKYDYRKEWLRFIRTLSKSESQNVANTAIRAVGQIVNSPGGIVWVQDPDSTNYVPVGSWESDLPIMASVDKRAPLVRFLRQRQWVIDLNEMRSFPARYDGLELGDWVGEHEEWWLILPLLLGDRLFGFIVLLKPGIVPSLNFEDHDLLRTVGRHVATYIDQAESDRRLAEASQFGTYSRLSAFLMHDLNNLIAQQSLVVKNAEKFRHNPEFVDDAINTIAHSVTRMRKLMEQLSSASSRSERRPVNLVDVLQKAVQRSEPRQPSPSMSANNNAVFVEADMDRLTAVTEHLIRNAQDATSDTGSVGIQLDVSDSVATVKIRDTGAGMTAEFLRDRLFRPFDSTKGSESMGIGAFQAREYVRALGGQLTVSSEVGQGTVFTLNLPVIESP